VSTRRQGQTDLVNRPAVPLKRAAA
jgi:hypothetical protein